jgi:hypothetical protein
MLSSLLVKAQNTDSTKIIEDFEAFIRPTWMWNFNYSISIPNSDFYTFIPETSYSGLQIEGRYLFHKNLFSVGFLYGWNGFYHEFGRNTINFNGGAITSDMFRTLYSNSIMANAHFYPKIKIEILKPYVGFQFGPQYNILWQQVGSYSLEEDNWDFGITPEVGMVILFGKDNDWGLNVSGRYNYTWTNLSESLAISYFALNFGLSHTY